ncbi:MAG TPA: long-chain fatty acid--CoA ligase [Blastocatellia bacterium]|nr:long-chain fatty acid--CoA ligase [Blastocatellia bacterium]
MVSSQPTTLNELFNSAVERYRESEFLRFKVEGCWRSLTFGEVAKRVRELALGLYKLGVRSGDRVAIWSENRPEWNLADLATLAIGAVDVPIYATQARSQVEYILGDSASRAIFVSSTLLEDVLSIKDRLPSLEFIISFDEYSSLPGSPVRLAQDVTDNGRALYGERPDLYENLRRAAAPEDLATILYTSGSTGDPKGVMLTHKNLTANALNSARWLELEGRHQLVLTYLPFTHIFERGVWYLYAHTGATIAYAESIDAVAQNLVEVRPAAMTSVPRMFEKIYARIIERGLVAGFPRRQIFLWSLGVGKAWAERKDRRNRIGTLLALEHKIADALVFKKWREALGGNIRLFISGGAPLAPEIAYQFLAAGMPILQGYGLTETSPSVSCNTETRNRIGTVGPVIDGVSVRIAEDGEILVKGDTVMKGYYHRPDDNEEAFTADGWLRTGDIGHVDEDGFLVITDRKKDLIKTSGGKYIAPQRLESLIKSSRFVSQVVVVGNARKFASALIVPNMELLRSYAELKKIDYDGQTDLLTNPRIIDLIQRQIDKYTAELSRFEKVKKVALLEHEFTIESGELTPTLKPRRSVIERKYAGVIDQLYEEEARSVVVV